MIYCPIRLHIKWRIIGKFKYSGKTSSANQHDRLDPVTQKVPHFLPHPRWRLYIEYIGKRQGQGRLYERP